MHIVLVNIHVKPEFTEDFKQATLENARNSIQESGVVRFDVLQQADAPQRFMLVEIYQSPEDQLKHRETRHYQLWRDTVASWMAEPRVGTKFVGLFPDEAGWKH